MKENYIITHEGCWKNQYPFLLLLFKPLIVGNLRIKTMSIKVERNF